MSTKPVVETDMGLAYQDCVLASWALAGADQCDALQCPGFADRSIQISTPVGGGWNGATVTLKGSNDGVVYEILRDPQGVSLSFTADGLKQISEITRFIKPVHSMASPTGLTVTVIAKKVN